MTNKEAIEILERRTTIPDDDVSWEEIMEAIDLAIKALEDIEEWNKLRLICASEGIIVYKVREDSDEDSH